MLRYMCEASNEAGNATAEFLLEILRRPILFANPSNLLVFSTLFEINQVI